MRIFLRALPGNREQADIAGSNLNVTIAYFYRAIFFSLVNELTNTPRRLLVAAGLYHCIGGF